MKDSRTTHRAAMGLGETPKDKIVGGKQKVGGRGVPRAIVMVPLVKTHSCNIGAMKDG